MKLKPCGFHVVRHAKVSSITTLCKVVKDYGGTQTLTTGFGVTAKPMLTKIRRTTRAR